MEIPQLMAIAEELGVKVSQDDELEKVIYDILDRAAESAANGAVAKPKRKRITKKDTDKVYTVNGKEGENFDVKNQKVKAVEAPSLFSDEPVAASQTEAPVEAEAAPAAEASVPQFPKHRGRKSKAELAAIAAAEAAKAEAEVKARDAEAVAAPAAEPAEAMAEAGDEAFVPEAGIEDGEPYDEAPNQDMLEQLQEHMAQHNQDLPAAADGIWEGDPGDGTDFITVVDLPIEDQAAIPTLDIFDRPVVQQP